MNKTRRNLWAVILAIFAATVFLYTPYGNQSARLLYAAAACTGKPSVPTQVRLNTTLYSGNKYGLGRFGGDAIKSPTLIEIKWDASTPAANCILAGYKVQRGTTQIGTIIPTNYTDSKLTPSTTYSYTVKAYDTAGHTSAASIAFSATTSADIMSPMVTITAPLNNSSYTKGATIINTATATDDVAVTKTLFYVDGVLKMTDTTAPYSYNLSTSNAQPGVHTLQAKSYDVSGNIGSSATINVTLK